MMGFESFQSFELVVGSGKGDTDPHLPYLHPQEATLGKRLLLNSFSFAFVKGAIFVS